MHEYIQHVLHSVDGSGMQL